MPQWHPETHEPIFPLHPTAAFEHDYDADAPAHDIKDYHPVPAGYRRVEPPHHHVVHQLPSDTEDDDSEESSPPSPRPSHQRRILQREEDDDDDEDDDSEPEFKEIHRHGAHGEAYVEELSMALLKDREA